MVGRLTVVAVYKALVHEPIDDLFDILWQWIAGALIHSCLIYFPCLPYVWTAEQS